jgi:outer membrane protein assembly factor BamA
MKKLIFFILAGTFAIPCSGKADEPDSLKQKRSGFIPIPILFYMPETGIGAGAAVNCYFREPGSRSDSKPSTIMPVIAYTQKKQMIGEISADLYWRDETYHLNSYLSYKKFPDKFYGIGNNTLEDDEEDYTPEIAKLTLNIQKKTYSGFSIGLQYEFEHNEIVEFQEDGLLAQGDIPGVEGGTTSGIGLSIIWDTRDNIFYPTSGKYCQSSASLFSSALGSDFEFKRYNLDFRQYLPLFSSHVLAFQGYLNIMTGKPPFQILSLLGSRAGGQNLMRGYYEGRYRDKNMIAFQMEYRIMPVLWRFGLVAFVGFGDVSDKMDNFEIQNLKYSLGVGIRYLFIREEKINVRFDVGYGKNSSGIYITIGEAF